MADDENTIVRDPNDWLIEFLVDSPAPARDDASV